MRPDAREAIENLDNNKTWLFDHMIVAFFHDFGIGNGLWINKEDVETIRYKEGPQDYRVKASVMREKLKEYLRWLESYQESWETAQYTTNQEVADTLKRHFYDPQNGWGDITRMIELLQI